MHVQDRGNEALPVDIVKVLKSQDEGYIRTMRTAGLKVRLRSNISEQDGLNNIALENRQAEDPVECACGPRKSIRRRGRRRIRRGGTRSAQERGHHCAADVAEAEKSRARKARRVRGQPR